MSDEFELLAGVDEPRPLPPDMRRRLEAVLTGETLSAVDQPRPVPEHLRRRIEARLAPRRNAARPLAVAAAVLLVFASAVAIVRTGRSDDRVTTTAGAPLERRSRDAVEAGTPTTASASEATTTTTPAGARLRRAAAPTTTAAARPTVESSADRGAAAMAASPSSASPAVTVSPSNVRRGEEVAARATGFSTTTVRFTLKAPSGRTVNEGEVPPEFRFAVPVFEETGRYVLVVENLDRTQRAETYLDVVA